MPPPDRSERAGSHAHNAAKRGSWHKLEQTFLQRNAGELNAPRRLDACGHIPTRVSPPDNPRN